MMLTENQRRFIAFERKNSTYIPLAIFGVMAVTSLFLLIFESLEVERPLVMVSSITFACSLTWVVRVTQNRKWLKIIEQLMK